jgi:hypothetical protein
MRNPKLPKILYEQRIKTFDVVKQFLDLQEEKGFFRKVDTEDIIPNNKHDHRLINSNDRFKSL